MEKPLNFLAKTGLLCYVYTNQRLYYYYTNLESASYYHSAIEVMNKSIDNPVYFVFSNTRKDLDYVKNYYGLNATEIYYVDIGEDEFDDLRFIYNCKHHIISNSTFSWWGSYLSYNTENITIAPSRWLNTEDSFEDIYVEGWKLITV